MGRDRRVGKTAKKVKPGDGSPLKPYRWWQPLYRSMFSTELAEDGRHPQRYEVDIDFFDERSRVFLYRDGIQSAVSKLPAAFPVPGGHIEVATSTFGLRRMHLVDELGNERVLTPHPRSGEGWRAALAQRHPTLSGALGITAVIVLLGSFAVGLPQLAQTVSEIDIIADNLGTFTSPIDLPAWLNTTLLVASIVASIERALTLRHHWLVDNDAGWFA